jgi:hypothetical protein
MLDQERSVVRLFGGSVVEEKHPNTRTPELSNTRMLSGPPAQVLLREGNAVVFG